MKPRNASPYSLQSITLLTLISVTNNVMTHVHKVRSEGIQLYRRVWNSLPKNLSKGFKCKVTIYCFTLNIRSELCNLMCVREQTVMPEWDNHSRHVLCSHKKIISNICVLYNNLISTKQSCNWMNVSIILLWDVQGWFFYLHFTL